MFLQPAFIDFLVLKIRTRELLCTAKVFILKRRKGIKREEILADFKRF